MMSLALWQAGPRYVLSRVRLRYESYDPATLDLLRIPILHAAQRQLGGLAPNRPPRPSSGPQNQDRRKLSGAKCSTGFPKQPAPSDSVLG
jgi:hypothetical protein